MKGSVLGDWLDRAGLDSFEGFWATSVGRRRVSSTQRGCAIETSSSCPHALLDRSSLLAAVLGVFVGRRCWKETDYPRLTDARVEPPQIMLWLLHRTFGCSVRPRAASLTAVGLFGRSALGLWTSKMHAGRPVTSKPYSIRWFSKLSLGIVGLYVPSAASACTVR